MDRFEPYRRVFGDIGPIFFRHIFVLVNAIIFGVIFLLVAFGDAESGVFLGSIIVVNILLGAGQDIRARISLETLQMMTALKVMRVGRDGRETEILSEKVRHGDQIRLRLGDQIPCDGELVLSEGLEVSIALLTGESDSFSKNTGDILQGGSIVTAGSGVFEAREDFYKSKMARMTEDAKKYAAKPSPIQQAITRIITVTGYVLLASIIFIITRGAVLHEPYVHIVLNVGALASTLVPQGLVVITTLLFAFGASSYMSKKVLFQEINATEKLGRIKNLCMDKTGTLTENALMVDAVCAAPGSSLEEVCALAADYIRGVKDLSQNIAAIAGYLGNRIGTNAITASLPFSSWRHYGAVKFGGHAGTIVFIGSPDVFMPRLRTEKEQEWLAEQVARHSKEGKRILCVARAAADVIPRTLEHVNLSVVGAFIFTSKLRAGVRRAVSFFQDRGVTIRIISGDNIETVRSVAHAAGVRGVENAVTGKELAAWSDRELEERVGRYAIFARIVSEQKVRIIEALKHTGFTAMIGDGVNDALAIKKADLGISMFEGAPATRRLAAVVLMDNRFTALPGGVELADNFIRNIEIFTGVFMNQTVLGLLFFIIVSALGYAYPLTPLNISFINYFAVGLPGMLIAYWALHPAGIVLPVPHEPFLKRIMPFVFWCALVEAAAVAMIFILSPAQLNASGSNTLVGLMFILTGFIFFALAPRVYRGKFAPRERMHLAAFGILEMLFLAAAVHVPLIVRFFDITMPLPSVGNIGTVGIIAAGAGVIQYLFMKRFFIHNG